MLWKHLAVIPQLYHVFHSVPSLKVAALIKYMENSHSLDLPYKKFEICAVTLIKAFNLPFQSLYITGISKDLE